MGMDAVADVKRKISRAKLPPPLIKPEFQPLIRFCQGLSIRYAITFGSEPPENTFSDCCVSLSKFIHGHVFETYVHR